MSKRWFDLIFTIIFAFFVVLTSYGWTSGENYEMVPIYIGYILIVLALRRFFYGGK